MATSSRIQALVRSGILVKVGYCDDDADSGADDEAIWIDNAAIAEERRWPAFSSCCNCHAPC